MKMEIVAKVGDVDSVFYKMQFDRKYFVKRCRRPRRLRRIVRDGERLLPDVFKDTGGLKVKVKDSLKMKMGQQYNNDISKDSPTFVQLTTSWSVTRL